MYRLPVPPSVCTNVMPECSVTSTRLTPPGRGGRNFGGGNEFRGGSEGLAAAAATAVRGAAVVAVFPQPASPKLAAQARNTPARNTPASKRHPLLLIGICLAEEKCAT